MSGSAFSPWAFYTQNHTKISAAALLYVTGCYFDNSTVSLDCLQKREANTLFRRISQLYVSQVFLWHNIIQSFVTSACFLTILKYNFK